MIPAWESTLYRGEEGQAPLRFERQTCERSLEQRRSESCYLHPLNQAMILAKTIVKLHENKSRERPEARPRKKASVGQGWHDTASQECRISLLRRFQRATGWVGSFCLAFTFIAIKSHCQEQATTEVKTNIVYGHVFDSSHHAVADATVQVLGTGHEPLAETRTDKSGAFTLNLALHEEQTLVAEKAGEKSRAVSCSVSHDSTHTVCDITFDSMRGTRLGDKVESGDKMEFSDQPNFTVAGLTDWTAVGGHGTDSSVRTSEVLAQEAQDLPSNHEETTVSPEGTLSRERTLRANLSASPTSMDAKQQLGEFYLKSGRYTEAIDLLRSVYEIEPSRRGVAYSLAEAYALDGDFTQADTLLKSVLIHNNDSQTHRLAARIDEKLGNPLAAVHEYEIAVRLDPSEQNYFDWGSELLLHRAIPEAQQVFSKASEIYPQSTRILAALSSALLASSLYQQAADALCKASDFEPSASDFYLFLGKVESASPAPLACVEPHMARFIKADPDNALAYYFSALDMSKRQEQNPTANGQMQIEALLMKATVLDPHCGDAYLQLGILSSSRMQFEKAVDFYKTAIRVKPQLSEAHYRLGLAYDRLHKPELARREFELHDTMEKEQADIIEKERKNIKQFRTGPAEADKTSR